MVIVVYLIYCIGLHMVVLTNTSYTAIHLSIDKEKYTKEAVENNNINHDNQGTGLKKPRNLNINFTTLV